MLLLIAALTFATIFIVAYLLLRTFAPLAGPVEIRLRALDSILDGRTDIDDELATPFSQRVLSPLTGSAAAKITRFTPQAIRTMVEKKTGSSRWAGWHGRK